MKNTKLKLEVGKPYKLDGASIRRVFSDGTLGPELVGNNINQGGWESEEAICTAASTQEIVPTASKIVELLHKQL